jgi:hypothetical protein
MFTRKLALRHNDSKLTFVAEALDRVHGRLNPRPRVLSTTVVRDQGQDDALHRTEP